MSIRALPFAIAMTLSLTAATPLPAEVNEITLAQGG